MEEDKQYWGRLGRIPLSGKALTHLLGLPPLSLNGYARFGMDNQQKHMHWQLAGEQELSIFPFKDVAKKLGLPHSYTIIRGAWGYYGQRHCWGFIVESPELRNIPQSELIPDIYQLDEVLSSPS